MQRLGERARSCVIPLACLPLESGGEARDEGEFVGTKTAYCKELKKVERGSRSPGRILDISLNYMKQGLRKGNLTVVGKLD